MQEFDIRKTAARKMIVVAHRGVFGGNIHCNTLTAYDIAVRSGADMIEIDVDRAKDGTLVIFHPCMEVPHLGYQGSIRDLTYAEIQEKIRYQNVDHCPTEDSLCTLDEVFERFKGKCFINVDKFWDNPIEISEAIRRHDMADQIIVKTSPTPQLLDIIEAHASDIQYLSIIRTVEEHELLAGRNLRVVGAEILFREDDAPVCSEAFLQRLHDAGQLAWANAIVYDYRAVIAARHTDDTAMRGDPEYGWGWLVDRGFDIIQTDWPFQLNLFLRETERMEKMLNA